jgi:plasmid stability protein
MASITVRGIDPAVLERLKLRARANRRTLEAELRAVLEDAASSPQLDMAAARARIEELQARFAGRHFPDTASLVREDLDP